MSNSIIAWQAKLLENLANFQEYTLCTENSYSENFLLKQYHLEAKLYNEQIGTIFDSNTDPLSIQVWYPPEGLPIYRKITSNCDTFHNIIELIQDSFNQHTNNKYELNNNFYTKCIRVCPKYKQYALMSSLNFNAKNYIKTTIVRENIIKKLKLTEKLEKIQQKIYYLNNMYNFNFANDTYMFLCIFVFDTDFNIVEKFVVNPITLNCIKINNNDISFILKKYEWNEWLSTKD
jgi:hypothetical protein